MSRSIITFSLPGSMRLFVEDRVDIGGYGTVSEYLRELIRIDQRRERERYDAAIARQRGSTEHSAPFRRD